MNMEGKARRAGYCPGAQRRSADRCSFRHRKARGERRGNLHRGEAPEGTCLKSMDIEGKARHLGYRPGAQRRSAGRCSFQHGKSRAGGGRIFTEGKRQMNRRGNLRRRESAGWTDGEISLEGETTGENLLEKYGHGRQSEARRVLSRGAMQKRRPV